MDHISAMAEQSQRPRLPTHNDLPFDSGSKKPVRRQKIYSTLADPYFEQGGFHQQHPHPALILCDTKDTKVRA